MEHLLEHEIPPWNMLEFIFSTGCRIGEIVSLEKNRINWSERSAIVKGKGDKIIKICAPIEVIQSLMEQKKVKLLGKLRKEFFQKYF
ncbi:tyrosine-type recombinase/integrase [Lysinibacillus sp. NPDC056959]|uniref:tyrosine-type recombinase/integrase n=1 Tax=Lysinibacillus sp. NPDC056959 TaxID=3345981 RepID=UPI003639BA89